MAAVKEYFMNFLENLPAEEQREYEEWLSNRQIHTTAEDDEAFLSRLSDAAREHEDAQFIESLKQDALIAEEMFNLDELEAHSLELRAKMGKK